jgi:hypothetical protein
VKARSVRFLVVSAITVLLSVAIAGPAAATNWNKPFDTDDISRSSPSNKAYTIGSFTWQWESCHGNCDERAAFSAVLHVQGARNSCARLKITTYVGDSLMDNGDKVEKHFPENTSANFGYYTYCSTTGTGSKTFTGADIQDRSIMDIGTFHRADIRVCWTLNTATPPGGDCYAFTIHPGD